MEEIFVTKPALPPQEEMNELLKEIWQSKIVTNKGKFHKTFEKELAHYLGVKNVSLCNSGTTGLMLATKNLELKGEVITTPFSFAATAHILAWNNLTPVFVDIHPDTFCVDPSKIEQAITSKTSAILAVHVFGMPCNVKAIQQIAQKNNLQVIYDACHAFGVTQNNHPIVEAGNLSVLSFHATKVFNTFEGGAVVSHNSQTKTQIDRLKNFGFVNQTTIDGIGINGKMNEFQAALGVLQLKYVEKYIAQRKEIALQYRKLLNSTKGISWLNDIEGVHHNYSYFPILINENEFGKTRDELFDYLNKNNIHTRRYFYPLISHLPAYRNLPSSAANNLPVAERVSKQVLCLPIYPELPKDKINQICTLINK